MEKFELTLAAHYRRMFKFDGCWKCGMSKVVTKMFRGWQICPICNSTKPGSEKFLGTILDVMESEGIFKRTDTEEKIA